MKPLQPHETLIMPVGEQHSCPNCGLWARGSSNIDLVFGWRRMGGRQLGQVRVIPWCKRCRNLQRKGLAQTVRLTDRDLDDFEGARGGYPGVVYSIHAIDRCLTKWGYTQAHPMERLRTFQTACPDELTLLGFFGADYFAETELHAELDERRVRGEWFEMDAIEARDLLAERGGYVVANDNQEVILEVTKEEFAVVCELIQSAKVRQGGGA